MHEFDQTTVITDPQALAALYGPPSPRALVKELDHVSEHYRCYIEAAPFAVIATVGPRGVDVSPRGDHPGFIHVDGPRRLMLPDRRGNNRVDTLGNIVRDGRLSILFLIPGIGETLRVVGRGRVVADPALCERFAVRARSPRTVLVIDVERVYFQCQKALARSDLWGLAHRLARGAVPTPGEMIEALDDAFDGADYDARYADYMKETLY